MSSSVWVQLYYGDKEKGSPEQIYESDLKPGRDWNVASLRGLVKDKMAEALTHCDAADLAVYPHGTAPPFSQANSIRPGKPLKEVIDELKNTTPPTSDDHPLIIVATTKRPQGMLVTPHNKQQQQQQDERQQQRWYRVSGSISRPTSHAGARYELFKLASNGGLYLPGLDATTAFTTGATDEANHSIINFCVGFMEWNQAAKFIDGIRMYLLKNVGYLKLFDDQGNAVDRPTTSEIPAFSITLDRAILQSDYEPQNGEVQPGSPLFDVVVETRSSDITVDVTLLSRSDPTFKFQRIENDASFAMAEPESAHIFPRSKCVGKYEWLDTPEFNRLALSWDVHVNFDGTGRGRCKRRKTAQTFAIRPLRPSNGYSICRIGDCACYRIPLELVLNDNEIAGALLTKLGNNADLRKHQDDRWTISGADVAIYHPQNRRVTLVTERDDGDSTILVTAIPGVKDLNDCWSNSPGELYTVEAAEILEKCLLWNYQNALESWMLL